MNVKIFFILIVSLLFVSCKDNVSDAVSPTDIFNSFFQGSNSTDIHHLSDYLESLYEPNLVGIVVCESVDYSNGLSWSREYPGAPKDYHEMSGIYNYAKAAFRNVYGNQVKPFNVSELLVNACLLRAYDSGAFAKDDPNPLDLYFGNGINKFFIEDLWNHILPDTVMEDVFFTNRIQVTNISRYDTIHKSQGVTINWIGGSPTGKVDVRFSIKDVNDETPNHIPGCSNFVDNTGSFTITPEILNFSIPPAPDGFGPTNTYWDLTVTSYEPIKRTLSNGKKVIFMGVTKYFITVTLAD